jgi:hypothetical protein
MIDTTLRSGMAYGVTSCSRTGFGVALIAGIALLSGCGPAPYNHTTTSVETTTTMPAPDVSTTTVTTQQNARRP